ncbi:MAG: OB-fold nucleic acid binding domain-containing protein [Candidatus Nanoarchaeia archaeon]|nr:OB-fold nucleic acid binding domain-containing protein [Candidatus Nanoarchaeia archaeon]
MPEPQKRQVACKARISELIRGEYVKEQGWNPNYISTEDGRQISRINLIAAVISLNDDGNQQSVVVDDGSANIQLRTFEKNEMLSLLDVGDIVLVIGRPREYGSEKYIMPEIIKKIENKKWIDVRKLELDIEENKKRGLKSNIKEKQDIKKEKEYSIEEIDEKPEIKINMGKDHETIYDKVKELDNGDGADIDEIIKKSKVSNAEEIIKKFMMEGEMFEIRPGKIKILE